MRPAGRGLDSTALNTCKITGLDHDEVCLIKIVNIIIIYIITKFANVIPYTCMIVAYKVWQETNHICRICIKKSNGPKFTNPRMSGDRPLFKRSMPCTDTGTDRP